MVWVYCMLKKITEQIRMAAAPRAKEYAKIFLVIVFPPVPGRGLLPQLHDPLPVSSV